MLAGCASTHSARTGFADAIRIGVEACERHLLDGLSFTDALQASAHGGTFAPDRQEVENWDRSFQPYRLNGERVWAGAGEDDKDGPDKDRVCEVVGAGGGGPALRDSIITERLTNSDREWTDRTANARGKKGVCTVDRVPAGRSVLLTAQIKIWWRVDTVSIPEDPIFEVVLEMQESCDRDSDFWMQ